MENIQQKLVFFRVFQFPCNYTEPNMNAISLYYDCPLQLLPVTWTVCQSSPCTHIMNRWLNLLHFYVLICQTNNTLHVVYFRLSSKL